MGKVCQWFKETGEILKDLIIRMRRITEMLIEELRSIENEVNVGKYRCPLYFLSESEFQKCFNSSNNLFSVNNLDIINLKFPLPSIFSKFSILIFRPDH